MTSINETKKAYRDILRATTLFGGVQVFNIFVTILRAKATAIFIGPTGMGITNLLTSSTGMIALASGLGLNFSALRDIAKSVESNDKVQTSYTVKVVKKWLLLSGLLGMILTICLSFFLSHITFGNKDYIGAYIWLSVTLFLAALANGNNMILQAQGRRKEMAKSSGIGSAFGLISTVPLFYFLGIKGIVPALIISATTTCLISFYFENKIKYEPIKVSNREAFHKGLDMAKLGIIMVFASFAGLLCTYALNAYIRYKGGLGDVGLFQAGMSLTTQYIGIVFTAMAMDFFPKISAISNDNHKMRELVNKQTEMILLIVTPLLVLLITYAPLLIQLLLSKEFIAITEFVRLMSLVSFVRATAYPVGYTMFAKGDKKLFLIWGTCGSLWALLLQATGYLLYGLVGVGIGLLIGESVAYIAIVIIAKKRYAYSIDSLFVKTIIKLGILCAICYALPFLFAPVITYVMGGVLFLTAGFFSMIEINKRVSFSTSSIVTKIKGGLDV